jgi:hypothetical protein
VSKRRDVGTVTRDIVIELARVNCKAYLYLICENTHDLFSTSMIQISLPVSKYLVKEIYLTVFFLFGL